ncbi:MULTISPECIES: 2-amino-4-hydroxy-6-hydroxymethyldihydropteridine diphosphokinase [unclassified Mesorhizobium]|uniref:2-amino-4-hydroxy-6- hydroxymethyldihydropteridine diphosphokinase n=1 Tax=unclassified Mesorhizobium TaxID=325217 RepID=UPI000BAF1395|nr:MULTISPECIES: 2-amino-4-hydroxy-6-hydroxymethyldihydropteridine diphosphokinase [unclassified Mesorhizobium]TGT53405.1 2-amino-4-hydroxy-6-hydroxymethyldihydropteridine diphosphokinase [Mesorhizobium sp. M00.F.Ca.ET.170.01.1.1]AZO12765.1 2-amino-4-hydroxy-6-hydroxymethyldihydropteridine diphosphokinase [Mesorhizobium sp. M3A.F.Ca.ET.080.04.2.1]PBB87103.1 2-amino-4-hydroxy-6-hydroxymethyldihydropteridine diphosphokinase [Mesorhizobium sp. WSM3876]RWB71261.1 MAG: 2-amino-4-hydroxy-6-hydroxymet
MSGPSNTVYLSLGGNLGDPAKSMAAALRMLDGDEATRVMAVSSLYRTPPWGKLDQPDFLNAAAAIETTLAPRALLDLCLDVERRLKRVREERWGPRLIDIDILMFGDRIIHETGLEVPHPRMLERAFVLAPLAEIAPDLAAGGRSVSERLAGVDASGIERLPSGREWWLG